MGSHQKVVDWVERSETQHALYRHGRLLGFPSVYPDYDSQLNVEAVISANIEDHPLALPTEPEERERAMADAARLAEEDLAAGRVVSHEKVAAWLRPWGTADELPPPLEP
jgi:predicted transcriptional regulator